MDFSSTFLGLVQLSGYRAFLARWPDRGARCERSRALRADRRVQSRRDLQHREPERRHRDRSRERCKRPHRRGEGSEVRGGAAGSRDRHRGIGRSRLRANRPPQPPRLGRRELPNHPPGGGAGSGLDRERRGFGPGDPGTSRGGVGQRRPRDRGHRGRDRGRDHQRKHPRELPEPRGRTPPLRDDERRGSGLSPGGRGRRPRCRDHERVHRRRLSDGTSRAPAAATFREASGAARAASRSRR